MDTIDSEPIVSLGQLPDDPLKMPPPYWRGNGAIFHILDSLESITELLRTLIPIHARTAKLFEEHYKKYPEYDENNEEAHEEFADITQELVEHEHKIRLKAEVACLMSAIEAEDIINRFCVFNLHRDIAESVEKLSPSEKLLVASNIVSGQSPKGNVVFEAIHKLSGWRNAFAHGHCVDRPTKTLRHNHFIPPKEYPGVPSSIAELKELVGAYLHISDYLRGVSVNAYTSSRCAQTEEIRSILRDISEYRFEGAEWIYDIILDSKEQKRIERFLLNVIQQSDQTTKDNIERVLIAVLSPIQKDILRMEFGFDSGKQQSRETVMASLAVSSKDYAKERAIALTRLIDLDHYITDFSD